jgi:hypothetical protein
MINRPFQAFRVIFSVQPFQGKSNASIVGVVSANAQSGISPGSIVNHSRHVAMTTSEQNKCRLLQGMVLIGLSFCN